MWALIDTPYLLYRAAYGNRDFVEDNDDAILYVFFNEVLALYNDEHIMTSRMAFCFDSRRSFRYEEYPEYRAVRKSKRETDIEGALLRKLINRALRLLYKKILPEIGFRVYRQSGLESDDILAIVARSFFGYKGRQAVIVTADNDLYQCITDQVHWYDPVRKKYYDPTSFFLHYELSPDLWYCVKEMCGCRSDNISGIPGIGEKTAILYLNGFLPKHGKKYRKIVSRLGRSIVIRNRNLVTLPHYRTEEIDLKDPVYNRGAFWKWMNRLGIESYSEKSWELFFSCLDADRMRKMVRRRKGKGIRYTEQRPTAAF